MFWEPLFRSFQVAIIATLIATFLGIFLAWPLARTRFPGRDILDVIITAPMVLPPTVLGYYLLLFVGRQSAVGRSFEAIFGTPIVFTLTGAVVAATFAALPFIVKSARAAIEDVDVKLIGAAYTLGAGPFRVFVSVILPLSLNGILAGVTLGFARALGEFGVTLMVAGNIPGVTQTASLAIYDAVQGNRDREAVGLVGVLSVLAALSLYSVNKLRRERSHGF